MYSPSQMTRRLAVHFRSNRGRGLVVSWCQRAFGRSVARTAGFNVAAMVASGLGGIIAARVLGPTVRGEYAAVMSWFGLALVAGGMGQPAALCYYVAREPQRARDFVATSRIMMLTTGTLALIAGELLAPILAHGNGEVTASYRIAFAGTIVAFVSASYIASLQGTDIPGWNLIRLIQPVLSTILFVVFWQFQLLTLRTAIIILTVTLVPQLGWAYRRCRSVDLAPGHARRVLIRPLSAYGAAQIAALTPAVLNANLDQMVLSQTVPAADLGHYAVAVTLSLLPAPLVTAIGNVAFPRLAAQRDTAADTRRLQRRAVLVSLCLSAALLAALSAVAPWLVPLTFGSAFRAAVPLLWILAPGSVFLISGQVVADLLRGRNCPASVARAQGFAAIFTVILLIALLPVVGVYGAAIASAVAYSISFAVMARRLWRLSGDVKISGHPAPLSSENLIPDP